VAATTACGSSGSGSANPNTLLKETFTGKHTVTSGDIDLTLTIDPSGSSLLSGPITLSFGGPFQSRGAGKLPESNFTVSASALGHNVAVGVISTGTAGYVTLQGSSYQLPAASFQKLESSFGQLSTTQGTNSGSSALAKLGIHPMNWLTNPTVVGTENVGGAQTDHIHAGVNVNAMLNDLSAALTKSSSLGLAGGTAAKALSSGIPAADRSKIAAEVKNPSVDGPGYRQDVDAARRSHVGRHRVHDPVLGHQSAADDQSADQREAVQPVPDEARLVRTVAPGVGGRHRQQQ